MKSQDVYIGNSSCNGIYHYKLVQGSLIALKALDGVEKCTYLCKNKNIIYGVIEQPEGQIFSYDVDNNDINKVLIDGSGPCHISVSEDRKYLCVSNYTDGFKQIFEIESDGSIGERIFRDVQDSKISHTHFMKIYKKYLYSVDLGTGCIDMYSMENGVKLIDRVILDDKIEPRHLCFFGDYFFTVTEKSCRIYSLKLEDKKISIIGYKELLPERIKTEKNYTGCAVKISKDGKYIYTTIRDHNSISVFKNTNGMLKLVQNVSSSGELPWDISFDSKEKYVLIANASSNEVCIYKRNKYTGKIKFYSKSNMKAPSCIVLD